MIRACLAGFLLALAQLRSLNWRSKKKNTSFFRLPVHLTKREGKNVSMNNTINRAGVRGAGAAECPPKQDLNRHILIYNKGNTFATLPITHNQVVFISTTPRRYHKKILILPQSHSRATVITSIIARIRVCCA